MSKRPITAVGVTMLVLFAGSVSAQTIFTATLDGSQQTPPNGSTASGSATLTLNAAQDRLEYSITLMGLDLDGNQTPGDPNDDVTNMHIHAGAPGVAGPVRFGLIAPGDDGDDIVINAAAGMITGAWEETDVLFFGGTLNTYLPELQAGNLYLNVHTTAFPPGEIRGQITEARVAPTLPEVGLGLLLLLLAWGGVSALRRKWEMRGASA